MLTQLLFVASLLLASFTGLSAQSASQNGGVQQFANGNFESSPAGTQPAGWTVTGTPAPVVVTGLDQNGNLNYANSAPNSVQFTRQSNVTLSQRLNVQEMGEILTLTFWLKQVLNNSPRNFEVDFRFNGQPLTVLNTQGSTIRNGFVLQTAFLQVPQLGSMTGFLDIIFASDSSNVIYFIDDVAITGSLIIGDPQFVGLRGQSYQVHGVDGEVYNLVSSVNSQVNAKFAFLTKGQCPVFEGVPAKNCWSHPGSYLGAIGVQQIVDGKVQQLSIVSGSAKQGFASVTLNGETMTVGTKIEGELFSVNFISSHSIKVKTEEFSFTFDNSDMFVNQAVSARKPLSAITAHGLFGQTHQSKIYNTAVKYIAGEVDDYVVADGELFGKDFVYNQFQA